MCVFVSLVGGGERARQQSVRWPCVANVNVVCVCVCVCVRAYVCVRADEDDWVGEGDHGGDWGGDFSSQQDGHRFDNRLGHAPSTPRSAFGRFSDSAATVPRERGGVGGLGGGVGGLGGGG